MRIRLLTMAVGLVFLLNTDSLIAVTGKDAKRYFADELDDTDAPTHPFCFPQFCLWEGNYVIGLSSDAATTGPHLGDRIIKVDGITLETPNSDATSIIWRHSPTDTLSLTVERNGSTLTLESKCRNGLDIAQVVKRGFMAGAAGDWATCKRLAIASGSICGETVWSSHSLVICNEGELYDTGRKRTIQDAALIYERMRIYIATMRLVPGGVESIRGEVLASISRFHDENFSTFASDLQRLLNQPQPRDVQPPESAKVESATTQGTAFAVDANGGFLTAHHVIKDATSIMVHCKGLGSAVATVERSSPLNDLALLRAPIRSASFLPLAARKSITVGLQVFTMGFPAQDVLGSEAKYTEGVISSLSGPDNEASLMQITVPVQPGNSGGPLVSLNGEVVGIVTSSAAIIPFVQLTGTLPQNVNWAVAVDFARPLLGETSQQAPARSRDEAIARAQRSVCLVTATHK